MSRRDLPVQGELEWYKSQLDQFLASGKSLLIITQAVYSSLERTLEPVQRADRLIVLDSSFNPPTTAHMSMAVSAVRATGMQGTRLLLLLAVNNADKAPKPASFVQRCAMMARLVEDLQDELRRCGRGEEQEQEGGSTSKGCVVGIDLALTTLPYFHEKSAALAQEERHAYEGDGESAPAEQIFLVGYDTLIRIFNPRYYKPLPGAPTGPGASSPMVQALGPLFSRARLRVTLRADAEWGGLQEQLAHIEDLKHGDALERSGGLREWGDRIEVVVETGADKGGGVVSSTQARQAAAARDWDRLGEQVPQRVREFVKDQGLYREEVLGD